MSDAVELAEVPLLFERWLAGRPLADRSRRGYARNVRTYGAWLAETATLCGFMPALTQEPSRDETTLDRNGYDVGCTRDVSDSALAALRRRTQASPDVYGLRGARQVQLGRCRCGRGESPFVGGAAVALPPGPPTVSKIRAHLEALTVAAPGPNGEFSREQFGGGWASLGEGCDVRERVLIRDGRNVKVGKQCRPTAGRWRSIYDGKIIRRAALIDVDHVVPLAGIRALAGPVDIRTTQIYVDVTDQRKADGIAALERTRHPLAA